MSLKNFFQPKTVAVIGVSRNPNKVGHVIFKNIIDGAYEGNIIPVNPNTSQILNHKVYSSILKVNKKVDLAIIAIPAEFILKTVHECNKKHIKNILIISSGFKEVGNQELETQLKDLLKKYNIRCIGVNCLGIFDAHNKLDTLFLPRYRLKRPSPGSISFICQSGAIGSAILDIATEKGHKFSKFISYGNATDVDESDLLDYLSKDKNTKVICLYIEGIQNGEKFYKTLEKVTKIKPVIIIKGGLTEEGSLATASHTGALAGKKEIYFGIFNQTRAIYANSLEEMFNIASIIEKGLKFKGNKIQVITNGGGYGIISTDNIAQSNNLSMAKLSSLTQKSLKKIFPTTLNIRNPLDLGGDATTERYRQAIELCMNDKNIDIFLIIILYQTPLITTDVVDIISEARRENKKPIIVVSTGAEFTENLSETLEQSNIPTFTFPENAIKAIDKIVWYEKNKK